MSEDRVVFTKPVLNGHYPRRVLSGGRARGRQAIALRAYLTPRHVEFTSVDYFKLFNSTE